VSTLIFGNELGLIVDEDDTDETESGEVGLLLVQPSLTD
jgi:hypothetical protein